MSPCTIIIATLARRERADSLRRAIRSLLEDNLAKPAVLVVVNGSEYDAELVAELERRLDIRVMRLVWQSFANAILEGRREVRTPFFGFLDDDDEYLPGAIDRRLAVFDGDHVADVVISNGYRRSFGKERKAFVHLGSVVDDPLSTLLRENWLASCGGMFRSASVPVSMFENYHNYLEWTWLAHQLVNTGKTIRVLDEPMFVINDTLNSASKSPENLGATIKLYKRLLDQPHRPELERLLRRRLANAHHSASNHEMRDGRIRAAWGNHLCSLKAPGGWRYIPFSVRLLAATMSIQADRPE